MLRIRLDINGRDIGEIGVQNTGDVIGGKHEYALYDLSTEENDVLGFVWHDRDDGASKLASLAMNAIDEEVLE